jgi:Major Facilitator Superfamily
VAVGNAGSTGFGAVFRHSEFRSVWFAQILSVAGDQLARVALTLLVYARTDSTILTALTYALTFLPDLFGGPLLSGLADRYPRRAVMVLSDVSRAGLVAVMAIPGMPLVAVCVLLVVVQLLNSPFNAARAAALPEMLRGDLFVTGQAVVNITYQTGTVAGYVVGGALVAFTGTHTALLIDAATFVASAILVRWGMRRRSVPARTGARSGEPAPGTWQSLAEGTALVWRSPVLRVLVGLACLSGFYIVAEGLAVPYSHALGGGALTAGLLFAAIPAGNALGMVVLLRLVPPAGRLRLLGPLGVLACVVMVVCAVPLGLVPTLVIWLASGAAAAYQTVAAAEFVRTVPDSGRGQAFGLASTSLRVAQGVGVVVAGALAEQFTPALVVAGFGLVGTLVALGLAVAWNRARGTVAGVRTPAVDN